jgi:hypothetical protein
MGPVWSALPPKADIEARVARDRGQERVEVAAAWRGERAGGKEQQDEGKEEAAGPLPVCLFTLEFRLQGRGVSICT